MGVRFGEHLRTQRLARGLTQAELGAGTYSTSYISLIETGRREPGPEVVRDLAQRLQLSPLELEAWGQPAGPDDTAYLASALAARQAWDLREYAEASSQAAAAAEAALAVGNAGIWWDMECLQAECLMKLKQFERSAALVKTLLAHPIAEAEALASRAHQMLSAAHTGLGRMAAALEHAREALRLAAGLPKGSGARLGAERRLVRALGDSGRLEEAWEHCRVLSELAEADPAAVGRGKAEWAIGNVAFMRGDHQEGAERHRRAARLLSPANDLELWARFNKESAAARLTGGNLDPETLDTIRRAEIAYTVIGATAADQLELTLLRARWLLATGSPDESVPLLRAVSAGRDLIGAHLTAEAELLLTQALAACGLPDKPSARPERAGEPPTPAIADSGEEGEEEEQDGTRSAVPSPA